jgi:hypothetical protein
MTKNAIPWCAIAQRQNNLPARLLHLPRQFEKFKPAFPFAGYPSSDIHFKTAGFSQMAAAHARHNGFKIMSAAQQCAPDSECQTVTKLMLKRYIKPAPPGRLR